MRFGNEVRTLSLDEMRRSFQAGEITAETWICKVGDSEWRKIAATSLDLGPPPELQSVTSVYERPAPTPLAQPSEARGHSFPKRVWNRAVLQENPLLLAVWVLLGTMALALILQRSGALHSAFSWIGQQKQYEAWELDVLGGPGKGTLRSAEQLWLESIPDEKFPFSRVMKQDDSGSEKNPAH